MHKRVCLHARAAQAQGGSRSQLGWMTILCWLLDAEPNPACAPDGQLRRRQKSASLTATVHQDLRE